MEPGGLMLLGSIPACAVVGDWSVVCAVCRGLYPRVRGGRENELMIDTLGIILVPLVTFLLVLLLIAGGVQEDLQAGRRCRWRK